jgi:hypothetical protein
MSDSTTVPTERPECRHFRRQWYRLVIPCVFAVAMCGLFAFRIPDSLWVALPALSVTLLVCALLHGGLTLSRVGIAWYVLFPKWRYRTIPWPVVREVRKSPFGLPPRLRLLVEPGRYEPWLWGTPRRDQPLEIEIWTQGFTGGEALWDAIQRFRSSPDG